jgi:hypothetical protein
MSSLCALVEEGQQLKQRDSVNEDPNQHLVNDSRYGLLGCRLENVPTFGSLDRQRVTVGDIGETHPVAPLRDGADEGIVRDIVSEQNI